MKAARRLVLASMILLASLSCWPEWPAAAWAGALSVRTWSYDPNWPVLLLLWFACPEFSALSTGNCTLTSGQWVVRILAAGAIPFVVAMLHLMWKARRRR